MPRTLFPTGSRPGENTAMPAFFLAAFCRDPHRNVEGTGLLIKSASGDQSTDGVAGFRGDQLPLCDRIKAVRSKDSAEAADFRGVHQKGTAAVIELQILDRISVTDAAVQKHVRDGAVLVGSLRLTFADFPGIVQTGVPQ